MRQLLAWNINALIGKNIFKSLALRRKNMKKILAIICFALLVTAGPAFASNWVLVPSGAVDVSASTVGAQVDVQLYLNYTGDISAYFTGIDIDFAIDLTEATPKLNKAGNPDITWAALPGWGGIATLLSGSTVSYAGGNLSGYNTWAMGSNLVATIPLLLTSTTGALNGGDFDAMAAVGLKGILDYYGTIDGLPGAAGPDFVGVPVPGAVYLLFSGLIGLLGLRRKIS
jgi:hypothetical protein